MRSSTGNRKCWTRVPQVAPHRLTSDPEEQTGRDSFVALFWVRLSSQVMELRNVGNVQSRRPQHTRYVQREEREREREREREGERQTQREIESERETDRKTGRELLCFSEDRSFVLKHLVNRPWVTKTTVTQAAREAEDGVRRASSRRRHYRVLHTTPSLHMNQ